jgi:hypothetical protein
MGVTSENGQNAADIQQETPRDLFNCAMKLNEGRDERDDHFSERVTFRLTRRVTETKF